MASASRMCERNLLPSPCPSLAPRTMPAMSTNVTVAGTVLALANISLSTSSRASGTLPMPRLGSIVAKGWFAARTSFLVNALNSVDLPTFGKPTIPIDSPMRPLSPTARRTPKLSVGHVTMLGMDIAAVIIALLTLVAGFAAGWALARTRSAAAVAERDAARVEVGTIRGERDQLGEALRAAEKASADATARLESERTSATEKIALLEHAQIQLKEAFASLSRDALDKNQQQFLALADARFKQAGAPLTETLDKVEAQMRSIEKERADAHASLRTQIAIVSKASDDLKLETAALVSALRKPQARGRWGELQLRRCVEHAGMTERCDFFEQQSVSTADGILRPDLVVRLVGGKSIVVDSKVTLAAYLEAHETTDDVVRDERLAAHAKHLRQHVDQLAAKAYWSQFSPSPEFVVLFVPGDAFLAAALDRDPTLFDDAFTKRVHIASPTTLISVLRAVAYAWQQDALAENAREVFELGRELYSRIGKLGAK